MCMIFKGSNFILEAETRNIVVLPNNITYDGDFCTFLSKKSCSTFLRIIVLSPDLILSTDVYWCALFQFSFYNKIRVSPAGKKEYPRARKSSSSFSRQLKELNVWLAILLNKQEIMVGGKENSAVSS